MSGSSPDDARSPRSCAPSETTVAPGGAWRRPYPRDRIAGRSPRCSSASARLATTGVLPLPPTRRLPTLITGRARRRDRDGSRAYHRRRQDAAAPYIALRGFTSMNQSEGTDDAASAFARRERGDDGERLVLGAAIGLDQRPGRRAEASPAHRIGDERAQLFLELALGLH